MAGARIRIRVFDDLDLPVQQLVARQLASAWLWHGDSETFAATFQRFGREEEVGVTLQILSQGVAPKLGGVVGAAPIEAIHVSVSGIGAPTGRRDATLTDLGLTPDALQALVDAAHVEGEGAAAADLIAQALFARRGQDFRGRAEDDRVAGGDFADLIRTGAGNDTVQGSAGPDRLALGRGDGDVLTYAGFDGPALRYANGVARLGDARQKVTGAETVIATARDDRMKGGAQEDRFFGGPGADRVNGGPGADDLHGDEDADRLRGGSGADSLYGGTGDDALAGGVGDDLLFGGRDDGDRGATGDDLLTGGPGEDRLQGGDGDDVLRGGEGADLLDAGPGEDRLEGGDGDDLLEGGEGADLFVFRATDGGTDLLSDLGPGDRLLFLGPAPPQIAADAAGDARFDWGAGAATAAGLAPEAFADPVSAGDLGPGFIVALL